MVFTSDDESGLAPTLRRRQLPLTLAFAMTVNKSQGQICLDPSQSGALPT